MFYKYIYICIVYYAFTFAKCSKNHDAYSRWDDNRLPDFKTIYTSMNIYGVSTKDRQKEHV